MQQRSIVTLVILSIVTFGIYTLFWHAQTKGELNQKGAQIPTAWLIIVPIANIYWYWKYYEGAEQVTAGKVNGILYFILSFFVHPAIPMLLAQNEYNGLGQAATPVGGMPQQPMTPTAPVAADPAPMMTPPEPMAPVAQEAQPAMTTPAPVEPITPEQPPAVEAPAPEQPAQQQPEQPQPPQNPPLVQ